MVLAEDLRKAVLQSAIEGKLTEQLDTDSNVDELIKKVKLEKENLILKKNARKDALFSKISEDEIPFEIPKNWRWERIGNIGIYKKGPFGSALTKNIFVPKGENTIKVYEQKNAIQKDSTLGNYYITRAYYEEKMKGFKVESGDIIVSCAGTIGETYVMPSNIEEGIINQALMRMNIAESINIDFFLVYFDHILKKDSKNASNGSAIKNIPSFDIFKNMLIPLPPLEEQKRIVDIINKIIFMIDEYEKIERELISLKKSFPDNMKKALLDAAFKGELVKQLNSDSNIYELLKKNKIDISEEESPFSIPDNWALVKLESIVDETIRRGKSPKYADKSKVLVFAQKCNLKYGGISLYEAKYLDEKVISKYSDNDYMRDNDIVINSTGTGTMGRVDIFKTEYLPENYSIVPDSHVTTVRVKRIFEVKYIYWFLKYNESYLESQGVGSTNQKELKPEVIKNLIIPLPPIEEQHRIVEKLEKLLPLCEDLKEE